MELLTIKFDSSAVGDEELKFKDMIKKHKNIIYFFYKDDECLYIGESKVSLYCRCYKNSPKEKDQLWFKNANKILIIQLDNKNNEMLETRYRRALEALFIVVNQPKYNKR